jgi:hypothetical protein
MVLAKTIGVLVLIGLALWVIFTVIGFLAATAVWTISSSSSSRRSWRWCTTTSSTRTQKAPQKLSGRLSSSGGVAEWLGRGLQSPVLRFESGRRLQNDRYRHRRRVPDLVLQSRSPDANCDSGAIPQSRQSLHPVANANNTQE